MRQRIFQAALLAAGIALPGLALASSGPGAPLPADGSLPDPAAPVRVPDVAMATAVEPVVADVPVQVPAEAPVDPAFGPAVNDARLDGMRGGDGNVSSTTNNADLRGRVDGNTASNVSGGANRVGGGAFGQAAGISTVIQNSGSNVLIQNSTIVNVQFVPSP